ncbi:hypothetical protein D3C80_1663310 [compost metagenome]
MIAEPQHRPLRQLANHPHREGQGRDQAFHEQAGPALAAFEGGLQAKAFAEGDHAGHEQAEHQHHDQSRQAGKHPQLRHQTAALKWRA